MTPPIIRRLSPRTPADWIALLLASGAGVGIQITDDWRSTALALVVFVAGVVYRFAPDDDGDGVPNVVEAAKERVFRVRPDVVLLLSIAFGLVGCAHWHAELQRAAIDASAIGQIEYLAGRGIEGSGDIHAQATATLEVCRENRCAPVTVTVESTDGAHVVVCASVWRLTTCEVVP